MSDGVYGRPRCRSIEYLRNAAADTLTTSNQQGFVESKPWKNKQ